MEDIKHVAFLNPHGNFDRNNSCWGEHPDFNGQLVYVKEVARALADMGINVDIITRKIDDPEWPDFSQLYDSYPDCKNLRIIRLPFGGSKFLPKEKLWPHIKEYADCISEFYDEEGSFPDFFTAHYADGGLAGVLLKEKMDTPFSFTAHSLAAQEMDEITSQNTNFMETVHLYNFHCRITAERLALKYCNQIIVSSEKERFKKYDHLYYNDIIDIDDESKFSLLPSEADTKIYDLKTLNKIASAYLKAMKKGISKRVSIDNAKIPLYFYLPDSDNEKKLLERFKSEIKI
ncbi:MAG: glycosyltransferase [Bacillota bacterium]